MLVSHLGRWSKYSISRLASTTKTEHRLTSSESMEHRQGHTSVRTKSFGDLISSNEPEGLPNSKSNPRFRYVEAIGCCYGQNYYTSVSTVWLNRFAKSFLYGIFTCRKIRVSASSCVHGTREDTFCRLEQRTPVQCLVK